MGRFGDVSLYEQLQLFAQGLYRNLSLTIPHKFAQDVGFVAGLINIAEKTLHCATIYLA